MRRRMTFTRAGEERREIRTVGSADPRRDVSQRPTENRPATRSDPSALRGWSREERAVPRPDRHMCHGTRSRARESDSREPPVRACDRGRDASDTAFRLRLASSSAERQPHGSRPEGRPTPADARDNTPAERASRATSPGTGSRRPTEDAGARGIEPSGSNRLAKPGS